jgi:F-type H+-transporting ATPase subunit b
MDLGAVLKSLNISPPALLVNMLGFALLYWALRKVYYGPISAFLAQREKGIQDALAEAERSRREAQAERDRLQQELEQIAETARDRIQQATHEAAQARDQILAEARQEAARVIDQGRQQLAREKERILIEIRDHAADVAVEACETILRRTLTDERHRVIVDEFLRDLESYRS